MQATDFGSREDRAERRRLDMPSIGSIFLESQLAVAAKEEGEKPKQVE